MKVKNVVRKQREVSQDGFMRISGNNNTLFRILPQHFTILALYSQGSLSKIKTNFSFSFRLLIFGTLLISFVVIFFV